MAIYPVSLQHGDEGYVEPINQIQANAVNKTDNIHPQYTYFFPFEHLIAREFSWDDSETGHALYWRFTVHNDPPPAYMFVRWYPGQPRLYTSYGRLSYNSWRYIAPAQINFIGAPGIGFPLHCSYVGELRPSGGAGFALSDFGLRFKAYKINKDGVLSDIMTGTTKYFSAWNKIEEITETLYFTVDKDDFIIVQFQIYFTNMEHRANEEFADLYVYRAHCNWVLPT